jgi:acyl-CoA synthetase (NDP forming)
LKVDSPDLPHKTEAGAVRVGIANERELRIAYDEITANARRFAPEARIRGVLVQEMVQGGAEVIVGISYDEQLGPTLLFGSGGVLVEIYNDVAMRRCPVSRGEALDMVNEVKGSRILHGYRGTPALDIDALCEVLVNVSHMAVALQGRLGELDINPLIVLPKGRGVKSVDALALSDARQLTRNQPAPQSARQREAV